MIRTLLIPYLFPEDPRVICMRPAEAETLEPRTHAFAKDVWDEAEKLMADNQDSQSESELKSNIRKLVKVNNVFYALLQSQN